MDKITKYKIRHKLTGKEWGYLSNKQDAENAILHLESRGYDYTQLEILEVESVIDHGGINDKRKSLRNFKRP